MQKQDLLCSTSSSKQSLSPLNSMESSQETLHDSTEKLDVLPNFAYERTPTPIPDKFNSPRRLPKSSLQAIQSTSSSLRSLADIKSNSNINRLGSGLNRGGSFKKKQPIMSDSESMEVLAHEMEILKIARDRIQPRPDTANSSSSKLGRDLSEDRAVLDAYTKKSQRRSGIAGGN
ncbi:hypothetical protein BCR33DRAFT_717383 [Rhizoclosmatium globosum]|uniref:Uncharacterized protein n=1 Tax=Rhizoclosmatium globosum TaxID=329046 RepID=A0A1Y2CBL8_9FUNG|nr:hypothetical protein BCR33DRAFT_717383 [Rhizoclosmatium globosum]|eukprot:ORY43725.1 hypothetical protein BCR33DRAFT_717383 [Rhizoclosmatium globosum]